MDKLPKDVDEMVTNVLQKGADNFEEWAVQNKLVEKV